MNRLNKLNKKMFINEIYKDFQEFNYQNNILALSFGVIFGHATKNYINIFLHEIILETIVYFISIDKFLYNNPYLSILLHFIWITFIWIATIILSFIILEYILYRGLLGLSSTIIKEDEKIHFEKLKKKSL
jgi:large-conductance mechanosensitive channel